MSNQERCVRRAKPLIGILLAFSLAPQAAPQAVAPDAQALQGLSLEELLNIRITIASKSGEKASDAPAVITIITKDELQRFGGTTLKDVLERAAGLIGSSQYVTDRSGVAPRGDQITSFSSSHVLFLINGRPVREVLEGGIKSELYETFPLDVVERIEIIKGPGSVLYGSNAFSAVINVVTVKAERNALSLTAVGGEAGAFGGSMRATVKKGAFSLAAAGRYLEKAEWKTGYILVQPVTLAQTIVPVTIPNRGSGTFLDLTYKNLRAMSAFNRWQNSYFIPDRQAAGGVATWQKTFTDLGYGWQASNRWRTDFNVTFTRSTYRAPAYPNIDRKSHEFLAEWANAITPSDKSRLVVGALYSKQKGRELFTGGASPVLISDGNRDNFALYAQANYLLTPALDFIAGLQANKMEGIELDLVPRAGLVWHPASNLTLKALYSEAFRSPSINETTLDHPALKGTLDLQPEKVRTADLSLRYQGEKGEVAVNGFFGRQTQVIDVDRSSGRGIYRNVPNAIDIRGVELEGKRYLGGFFVSGSLLYQKSSNTAGQDHLSPIASFGAKLALSYRSERGVTLSVSNVYQGPLDQKYDTQINPSPGAYDLLSLHCNLNLREAGLDLGREVELFLQGDNLLNEEVWLPAWGLRLGSSMPYNQGRAVYAGLNVTF